MDLKELEQLIGLLKPNDISELEIEHDGMKVKLVRGGLRVQASNMVAVHSAEMEPAVMISGSPALQARPIAADGLLQTPAAVPQSSKFTEVKSPIVGTFYRRPSPDAEPFVKEGDTVRKGDTLCIIEAMKLMNEIEATVDGKLEKILLSDGKVVEYGEVLFLINPSA